MTNPGSVPESPELSPADQGVIYEILSRLLYVQVDEQLLSFLRNPALISIFREADPEIEHLLLTAQEEELAAMGLEYSRLFLEPEGVSPLASLWARPGEEFNTGIVEECIRSLGIAEGHGLLALPRDHVGLILALAGEALCSEEQGLVELGRKMESELLGDWVLFFADALHKRSESPLYRAVGVLLALSRPMG